MKQTVNESQLVFLGSYAEPAEPSVYVCEYDPGNGSLQLLQEVTGMRNPTFLDVDSERRKLYALGEGVEANGEKCGMAYAYEIDRQTGKLTLLNGEMTVPGPTCHIHLDRTRQCIMSASYHGSTIGINPLLADGRIGQATEVHRHSGSSILPVQNKPHPHSVNMDRNNRYAIVPDLGLDKIMIYKLDTENYKLIHHQEIPTAPGAGPRHFVFHPTLSAGYVINELNATVTAYDYDDEQGILTELQTVSTLPESYQGENSCADIHISPDGKFLYGSNRGHDSIAVYAIDQADKTLSLVEIAPTLGGHPRNFAISPDGEFLLAANRDSDNIVTFRRDAATGKLHPNGRELRVSKPVCIKFFAKW